MTVPDEEYDFAGANARFSTIKEELADDSGSVASAGDAEGTTASTAALASPAAYAKDDFFDSISCEATDRMNKNRKRFNYADQRKLDSETFGTDAAIESHNNSRYRGRNRRNNNRGYRR